MYRDGNDLKKDNFPSTGLLWNCLLVLRPIKEIDINIKLMSILYIHHSGIRDEVLVLLKLAVEFATENFVYLSFILINILIYLET